MSPALLLLEQNDRHHARDADACPDEGIFSIVHLVDPECVSQRASTASPLLLLREIHRHLARNAKAGQGAVHVG
jgi:hypothetical protein